MCSTSKLSKYIIFTYKAIRRVPLNAYSSKFTTYASLFILGKLILE